MQCAEQSSVFDQYKVQGNLHYSHDRTIIVLAMSLLIMWPDADDHII